MNGKEWTPTNFDLKIGIAGTLQKHTCEVEASGSEPMTFSQWATLIGNECLLYLYTTRLTDLLESLGDQSTRKDISIRMGFNEKVWFGTSIEQSNLSNQMTLF